MENPAPSKIQTHDLLITRHALFAVLHPLLYYHTTSEVFYSVAALKDCLRLSRTQHLFRLDFDFAHSLAELSPAEVFFFQECG